MPQVTVGSFDFDSYIGLDEADEYLAGDVARATDWAIKNEDARSRALSSATRMLQRLVWNDGVPPIDGAPEIVQQVTAMLAADLLADPDLFNDGSGASNVKSVKAGSASVEFFSPAAGGTPIPRWLWDLLVAAGLVGIPGAGEFEEGTPIITGISCGYRPLNGRWAGDYVVAAEDHD